MKIFGSLLFFALCSAVLGAEPAQTVFVNGNIYTMNERQPRAEAIAVKDGRIVFVGSNADAKKYQSAETKTVDLAGKTVVPGLTDSHCHIFGIGEREMNLNLEGANTLEDFLAKVKERAAKTERGKRSEEHTSELQSQSNLVCRLLLEKKKNINKFAQRPPRPITGRLS